MKLRQLWKLLSGVALLVIGLLVGASAPAGAETGGGCAGDIVVALGAPVAATPGEEHRGFTLSPALPAGRWAVSVGSSADASSSFDGVPSEGRVVVEVSGHTTLGPTGSIADGASRVDDVGTITSTTGVDHITVRHAGSVSGGPDRVVADCIAFTLINSAGAATFGAPSVECTFGARTVVVDVHNPSGVAVDAVITIGGATTPVALAPGEHRTIRGPADGDRTTVRATVDGQVVIDTVVDTSCGTTVPPTTAPPTTAPPTTAPPTTVPPTTVPPTTAPPTTAPPTTAPPVTVPPTTAPPVLPVDLLAGEIIDCASREVGVVLANFGSDDAMVDVAIPRATLQSAVTVDAGALALTVLALGDLADGTTEVRVTDAATGEEYLRTTFELDCVPPSSPTAAITVDCAAGTLLVELGNDAGGPATLTVIQERVAVIAEELVLAGTSTTVPVPLGDQRPVLVRVIDADGNDVLREAVDHDCVLELDGDDPDADDPDADNPDADNDADDPAADSDGTDDVATSDDDADAENDDTDGAGATPGAIECAASINVGPPGAGDEDYAVRVEVDGALVIDGTAAGNASLPVVSDAPTEIVVTSPAGEQFTRSGAGEGCAEIRVTVTPDCASSSATISIERDGTGRERFVVLLGDVVGGVISIEGAGEASVPVKVGSRSSDLAISRSDAAAPVEVGTLLCERSGGISGPVAASLVTLAVLATAAGVLPFSPKLRPV